jgi:hypothetical protein
MFSTNLDPSSQIVAYGATPTQILLRGEHAVHIDARLGYRVVLPSQTVERDLSFRLLMSRSPLTLIPEKEDFSWEYCKKSKVYV